MAGTLRAGPEAGLQQLAPPHAPPKGTSCPSASLLDFSLSSNPFLPFPPVPPASVTASSSAGAGYSASSNPQQLHLSLSLMPSSLVRQPPNICPLCRCLPLRHSHRFPHNHPCADVPIHSGLCSSTATHSHAPNRRPHARCAPVVSIWDPLLGILYLGSYTCGKHLGSSTCLLPSLPPAFCLCPLSSS
jgi:hypothetical protein